MNLLGKIYFTVFALSFLGFCAGVIVGLFSGENALLVVSTIFLFIIGAVGVLKVLYDLWKKK